MSMQLMKKQKPRKHPTDAQRKSAPQDFDAYFVRVPEAARERLREMRAVVLAAVPAEATETISYGMPAFRYKKKVLVWFAGFAKHCSLFPTAVVIQTLEQELKNYSTSKGTIQFPFDKRIPAALIRKVIKVRVAQLDQKKKR
jgi:uncharacterized protein YdhG (YjbR/CyaY superfamily)